jgi:hypothetical protein
MRTIRAQLRKAEKGPRSKISLVIEYYPISCEGEEGPARTLVLGLDDHYGITEVTADAPLPFLEVEAGLSQAETEEGWKLSNVRELQLTSLQWTSKGEELAAVMYRIEEPLLSLLALDEFGYVLEVLNLETHEVATLLPEGSIWILKTI